MSDVTIFGIPQSTYVRTVRMACHEKGVSYDLEPLAPQSAEMLSLNPTGKVPAFKHGQLGLYETSAITRYLDEVFSGEPLQPSSAVARARMNQWISEINDTIYQVMLREIILPRLGLREATDEALSASAKVLDGQLRRMDAALRDSPYLAGDDLTLADLFLLPLIHYLQGTPEGKAALPALDGLNAWIARMGERESCKVTIPQMAG